jgi:serine/threonine protein kinase
MSGEDGTTGRMIGGRYRLLRVVGQGGMGVLWAAHDAVLQREVAVKEIRPRTELPPRLREQYLARALREARAAARIAHPSAVAVYDVVEQDHRPWIVMELLAPRSLADDVDDTGPLPPITAAKIGLEILDALRAAHRVGVLHGDVKPGNVLFRDGRAVLVDFGLAAVDITPVEADAPWTAATKTLLIGSPAFMSPERAGGEPLTPAGDLWSLGATLFAAVEGHPPFGRGNSLATLAAVLTEEPPVPRHAGALRVVLAGLLARDPGSRPDVAHTRDLLLAASHWPDDARPPRHTVGTWQAHIASENPAPTPSKAHTLGQRRPPEAPRRLVPAALIAVAATLLLALPTLAVVLDRSLGTPTTIAVGGPPPTQPAGPAPQTGSQTETETRQAAVPAPKATPRPRRTQSSRPPAPRPSARLTHYVLTAQHTSTTGASAIRSRRVHASGGAVARPHRHRDGHGKGGKPRHAKGAGKADGKRHGHG